MIKSKDKSIPYYQRRPADLRAVRKKQLENMLHKVKSLPNEEWREVFGTKIYFVSNLGRVKCLSRAVANKHGTLSYKKEKILGFGGAKKYPHIILFVNGQKEQYLVHRLVAIHFIPNPDNKPQVNHIKGTKHGNCVENLEWVTVSENGLHAYKNGMLVPKKGIAHRLCKITFENIQTMRDEYKNGKESYRSIAKRYNLSYTRAYYILKNKVRKDA